MKERYLIINRDTGKNEVLFSCIAESDEDCWNQLEKNPPAYYKKT